MKSNSKKLIENLLLEVDYWKERCLLIEDFVKESPIDPDVTFEQMYYWNEYNKFIEKFGRKENEQK